MADDEKQKPALSWNFAGLLELWTAKQGNAELPKRSDFSARDLKPWISNIAIVEAVGTPRRYRIRLMGSACVRIAGADNTGKWLDECTSHNHASQLIEDYGRCLNARTPMHTTVEYIKEHVRKTTVDRLYLPCTNDGGEANFLIIAVYGLEELAIRDLPLDMSIF